MERQKSVENCCPVCHDTFEIFAIGSCDHPVCHVCATRMRVLCEQFECPICRSPMSQVAFMNRRIPFKDIDLRRCFPNRKNKIFYEDEDIEQLYLQLLEYKCRICHDRKPEKTFASLQTHMRREHQLFACDLCISHLKIFPFERKFYTRKNLATHRRIGDEDDKSYKGHPLCEFCDARYNDKDDLLKHLRKDHYFCHFCDQLGSNAYYDQYSDLKKHFSEVHFLCTEDECGNETTRFTHAFASEIDLKAHKNLEHNKNMSRAQARELRTIDVSFQLPPRRQGHHRNNHYDEGRSVHSRDGYDNRRNRHEDMDLQAAIEASKISAADERTKPVPERVPDYIHDFPTLSGDSVVSNALTQTLKDTTPVEDFPSLSTASSSLATGSNSKPTQQTGKDYASAMNFKNSQPVPKPTVRESKPVPLRTILKPKERKYTPVPQKTEEDYPSLGNISTTEHSGNISLVSWNSQLAKAKEANTFEEHFGKPDKSINLAKNVLENGAEDFPLLTTPTFNDKNVFGNSNTKWAVGNKPDKKTNKPRNERYGDESFEVPHNFYLNNSFETERSKSKGGDSKPPVLSNKSSDFPGLPSKQKKSPETKPQVKNETTVSNSFKMDYPESKTKQKKSSDSKAIVKVEKNAELSASRFSKEDYPDLPSKQTKSKPIENVKVESSATSQIIANSEVDYPGLPSRIPKSTEPKPKLKTNTLPSASSRIDYPGLPSRETKSTEPKPKEKTEINNKKKKSKKSKEENTGSLNNIALSLVTSEKPEKNNNTRKAAAPDWFDGPETKINVNLSSNKTKEAKSKKQPPSRAIIEACSNNDSTIDTFKKDDFPSLHTMSAAIQEPRPPPGLTIPKPKPTSRLSVPPGLKPLSQSLVSEKNLPQPAIYIQPLDFSDRNMKLILTIKKHLEADNDGFTNFKTLSSQYRHGLMEASDYYFSCQALMGPTHFARVFPDLISLLPDIQKQQDLWSIMISESRVVSQTGKIMKDASKNMISCTQCGQVLFKTDDKNHKAQHSSKPTKT